MGHTPRVQCIRQPGRSPYFTLQVRRRRHYLGIDPKVAYRKAALLMADVPISGEPLSVSGLINRWLHEHPSPKHVEVLRPWALFQADTPLDEFDGLRPFAKHLIERGLAPETIKKYVGIAKRVCRWGVEAKWLPPDLKMPEKLPRPVVNPKDIPDVLLADAFSKLPDRARPVLEFMLFTGCRPSEATNLQWTQIDFRRCVCKLLHSKTSGATGKPRVIYLTPESVNLLNQQPRRSEFVFLNRNGRPYKAGGLRTILRRRGIHSVYSLRHTFAQHALDQTSAEDVAKLLGHSSLEMVRRYCSVRDERSRQVAAGLTGPLD